MVEDGLCQPPSVRTGNRWKVPTDGQVVDDLSIFLAQLLLTFKLYINKKYRDVQHLQDNLKISIHDSSLIGN